MIDLLVVGAGPAGLTAAWRAARHGLTVRVVERAPQVGGLTACITVAGQRVDIGSHRLHPATAPHLLAAMRELLGDELQSRTRHGRLRIAHRWVDFPLRAPDLMRRLPPRLALDAMAAKTRRPQATGRDAPATYADTVRARFGASMLAELYGPFARKLWGVDPEALEGEVARHRISATGATDLVRRALAPRHDDRRAFFYPRSGFGRIGEALAEAAVHAGATIDLAADVRAVRTVGGVASVDVNDETLDATRVLWTAPVGALGRVLDTTPSWVHDDLSRQRTRAMVLVYLVVDSPRYTEYDAHYLPDIAVAMTRVSEPKNYRDGPDPTDRTVLCAEIPCWIDEPLWRDAETLGPSLVLDGLARSGLPTPRLLGTHVHRCPSVYPVLETSTAASRARIDAWASSLRGITLLGRQGLSVADNLHHVMAMGWDAGELAGAGWDDSVWATHRESYRANVVQD